VRTSAAAPRSHVLIEPAFFDTVLCQEIRVAMDRGHEEAAEIVGDRIERQQTVRDARSIDIDATLTELVERRLEAARATIERDLACTVGAREGVGFLRYHPGGFYRRHQDRGHVAGWADAARRRVTLVVFLNQGSGHGPGTFDGGRLHIFPAGTHPVAITPRTGLLVAFPSHLPHEVEPVAAGVRDCAVDWFYDAD
jgi:predicted 2-oxoglutarate/Fe(II)-dependent dioxygenase YbiX